MANTNNHHVVPHDGGRASRREWSERVSAKFDNQAEAINYARDHAKYDQWELFVHGRNGQIRERNTYGNDPFPPKN